MEYFCDPINGQKGNPGTRDKPWLGLESVVASKVFAKVVQSGDVVNLLSGVHGTFTQQNRVNADYVTIQAAAGHTPVVYRIFLKETNKWRFRDLTVCNPPGVFQTTYPIANFRPNCNDIAFTNCTIYSQPDSSAWTDTEWEKSSIGIAFGGKGARIANNTVRNVSRGMMLGSSNIIIEKNSIDTFYMDGINFTCSDSRISRNTITNHVKVASSVNHNDGIQGWALDGIERQNVTIDGNIVIQATGSNPRIPAANDGAASHGMQGICIFDGKWRGLKVTNNYVRVYHNNGMSLYGLSDSVVSGNVIHRLDGPDPAIIPWLQIRSAKDGTPPANVLVRGNVAERFLPALSGVTFDSNVYLTTTTTAP